MNNDTFINNELLPEIINLINQARFSAAIAVNAELTALYWNIGKRINNETLGCKRAEYGAEIIKKLSSNLTMEFGKGWSDKHLRQCMQFSNAFTDKKIVYTLCRQLSWSHFRLVMFIEDTLKRDFYLELCRIEHWSVRQLKERINSLLFERTAISRKPESTIKHKLLVLHKQKEMSSAIVFRDPYLLDFLGLSDTYSEKDLESAIIFELQKFIIEMGSDFAFLSRQKRITIDNRDYYIDLLFYHRRLRRIIAIELKIGEFEAAFKGQMELYLRYLEKHEKMEGENPPIGLILCTGKNNEHVELMQLDKSNIHVAEYLTQLPTKQLLLDKLHKSIAIAKNRHCDINS